MRSTWRSWATSCGGDGTAAGASAQVAAATRPQALDGLVLMDTTHGPLEVDRDLAATVVLDFLGGR